MCPHANYDVRMDNGQRAQIGGRIVAARAEQGLTQDALAGVTANTVRSMERGVKVRPGNLAAVYPRAHEAD